MKNIILIIGCLLVTHAMAQKNPLRKQRLIISHGVGYSFLLNNLYVDPFIDQLNNFNQKGPLLNAFTLNWFLNSNLGVELKAYVLPGNESRNRKDVLQRMVEEQFGDHYYYSPAFTYGPYAGDDSPIFIGSFGLTYKIEKKRFTYIPGFHIGGIDLTAQPSYYKILKEKDSNTMLRLDYRSLSNLSSSFTYGPEMSVMYRLNTIVGIKANLSYLAYKALINYERTVTDLAFQNKTVSYYKDEKTLHRIHADLSIAIGFGRRGEWVGK